MPKVPLSLDGDRRVPRDIFPLPSVKPLVIDRDRKLSRPVVQRLQRAQREVGLVDECILALNSLYSGLPIGVSKYNAGGVSQSQCMAIEHICNSVQMMGPPPSDLSCPEALRQLRAFDGYSDNDQVPCSVESYVPSRLSLPSSGNRVLPIADLLGADGLQVVDEFIRSRVLPEKEARSKLDRAGIKECYSDPLLKEPKRYAQFLRRLADADLVEFVESVPVEKVEAFFVGKKDGRLRMVIDSRRANCWFAPPDKVRLCTAEALSRIELEPGSTLTVCTADLKDAFYHFELPESLRQFFGMRRVTAGDVGVDNIGGRPVPSSAFIHPRLRALPMGWSHALWFCQMIHQRIVQSIGAGPHNRLEDKTAAPSGHCLHLEYVDNFVVLGTSSGDVTALSESGVSALRDAGFVVHEEETSHDSIKILGWEFKHTRMKPKSSRVWRVRLAMQQLLKTGVASGRQLEKVLGHANFIALGRREALSIFGETYTFIQRHYHVPHRLWRSVRRELQVWVGVSPLIWRDLALPWSSEVLAVDASTWGLGATSTTEFEPAELQQLGKFSERWRFDSVEFKHPRASAFGLDVNSDGNEADVQQWAASSVEASSVGDRVPIHVVEQKQSDEVFQQTPFSAVQKEWHVCGRFCWKRAEPIPVLEGRAALFAVKHKLRSADGFHRRHLFLSDSISAVCSIDKGRGGSFKMRRVTQQLGALFMVSGSTGHFRWVPSEWNPADGPSRGSRFPSMPHGFPSDGGVPCFASGQSTFCPEPKESQEGQQGPPEQKGAEATAVVGHRKSGSSVSGSSMQTEVPGLLQKILLDERPDPRQADELCSVGPSTDLCFDRDVRRGRGHQPGQLYGGRCPVRGATVQEPKVEWTPQYKAEPSRVEETGPTKVETWYLRHRDRQIGA